MNTEGKIIRLVNNPIQGCYAYVRLGNGKIIFISFASKSIQLKGTFLKLFPGRTVWEVKADSQQIGRLFRMYSYSSQTKNVFENEISKANEAKDAESVRAIKLIMTIPYAHMTSKNLLEAMAEFVAHFNSIDDLLAQLP